MEFKEGELYIYKDYSWGELRSYKVLEIEKILKTKIKFKNKIELSINECSRLIPYNEKNLENVRLEFKESFKKDLRVELKEKLNSKLKLTACMELLEELMSNE